MYRKSLKWLPIREKLILNDATMMHKCINKLVPDYLADMFKLHTQVHIHNRQTRLSGALDILCRLSTGQRSFAFRGAKLWNSLNDNIQRECPRRPREVTKMWHMLEKLVFLIFCSEIPHDELINVVYLFCSNLLLSSKKIEKIAHVANHYKMVDIKGPSNSSRTLILKSAEASSLFFFLCISMGGI